MKNNQVNKKHWDNFKEGYSNNWKEAPKVALSKLEINFINKYLNKTYKRILDIGIGNGRILENVLKKSETNSRIYGIDISEEMVRLCKKKFEKENRMKSLKVCDFSTEEINIYDKFDFISAIRVIKYNKDWDNLIHNVYKKLNKNGIFVFSMLNSNSLSRYAHYGIPVYLTNKAEIESILKRMNFEIIEITSLSKLPAFLYLIDNNLYSKLLINIEKLLEKIFGKTLFGKEFFIAVKKKQK